jgi:hypothetical protein
MLGDPAAHPIERFASQRVRCCAEVFVELEGRKPVRALSLNPFVLEFDGHGVLDREAHQRAMVDRNSEANQAIAGRASSMSEARRAVMNAAFWTPSEALAALIHDTALGKHKARRP